jgi:glycosyltransferase involved in cell wall biosynthesis
VLSARGVNNGAHTNPMRPFRVVAIISAFNEGDIIEPVIEHLVTNGVGVYLIDNLSTDDTVARAMRWEGRGLVGIERFPAGVPAGADPREYPCDWTAILMRKERLASELEADWFIHHDADEFREAPWPGMPLADAIQWVDRLGFNCIGFRVLNFPPVDNGYRPGSDPAEHFHYYEDAAQYDVMQFKCWKKTAAPVSLIPDAGHAVTFPGRRIFPVRFILRHYPVRSEEQGRRKIFEERLPRFLPAERAKGWHIQYDSVDPEHPVLLADVSRLKPWDAEQIRLELMSGTEELDEVRGRLGEAETRIAALVAELELKSRELATLERQRQQTQSEADALRQAIARLEAALSSSEQSLGERLARLKEALEREAGRQQAELTAAHARSLQDAEERLAREAAEGARLRAAMESRLRETETATDALQAVNADLDRRLRDSEQATQAYRRHATDLEVALEDARRELAKIHGSRVWRLAHIYWLLLAKLGLLRNEPRAHQTTLASIPAEKRVPATQHASPVRVLAFYLPQFHPIPENDAWWGKGFTEWTNVTRALPQFEGHAQPLLPGELGFYDLRLPDVREAQARLAREHGIDGFCYYYYWFGGKKLLERPLEEMLASGKPDFPFCICWANENWTRRWDGQDDEILIAQQHSPEHDAQFIEDVLPALCDPRYIRVDGKPMLLVYRADLLVDPLRTTSIWREAARRAGLPGLHLCAVWKSDDPHAIGFDALVEFPPHHFLHKSLTEEYRRANPGFHGEVYDYAAGVEAIRPLAEREFPVYRGVMPAWDNTARRGAGAHLFVNGTPELYRHWLERVVSESATRTRGEQFVFINAWNEWAEGAVLEPSQRHGRTWLETTREAIRRGRRSSVNEPVAVAPAAHAEQPGQREFLLNTNYGLLALLKVPAWLLLGRLSSRLEWWRQMRAILRAGEFDREFYVSRYPDVAALPVEPVYHYVRYGRGQGFVPAPVRSKASPLVSPPPDTIVRSEAPSGTLPVRNRPATSGQKTPVRWTSNSEQRRKRDRGAEPLLFVGHDAARAGSQIYLLELLKSLASDAEWELFFLLRSGGELRGEYERVAHVLDASEWVHASRSEEDAVVEALQAMGGEPLLAVTNTVASGTIASLLQRRGLRVISIVHELPTTIDALGESTIHETVSASRTVVVVSHFVRNALLARYSLPPDRLQVIHAGVPGWIPGNEPAEPARRSLRARFGIPADGRIVLGCGWIHHRKGTDLFVQVARKALHELLLDNTWFIWVGPDESTVFRSWCEHDIDSCGLRDRIILAGHQSDPSGFYLGADAFLLTSREDPFPLVSLEAMARGLPVIAFRDAGGASEALDGGAGIVVPYLDTDEMARSLVRLLEAPRFAEQMRGVAAATARTQYVWSRFAGEFRDVIRTHAAAKPMVAVGD